MPMKWKVEYEALRNALSAADLSPHLFKRLSLEKIEPDEALLGRTRDWIISLKQDPGWAILEPNLTKANAFPNAYFLAAEKGFSERSDHHHALIFEGFATHFLERKDFQSARYAILEWFRAWVRISASDYIDTFIKEVGPDLAQEEIDDLLRHLLPDILDTFFALFDDPAGLRNSLIDTVTLKFFKELSLAIQEEKTNHSTLQIDALTTAFANKIPMLNAQVNTKFLRDITELEMNGAANIMCAPFEYVRDYYATIGMSATISQQVITECVEFCWSLRKLDLDEGPAFSRAINICDFFNKDLVEKLVNVDTTSNWEAFGHNSTCSDFLVFQAELADRPARRQILELGLKICPGHRNSSLLLSFDYLHDIDDILLKSAPIPSARMMIKWGKDSIEEMFEKADACLRQAEEIYPTNEKLDKYKKRVRNEKARLGL